MKIKLTILFLLLLLISSAFIAVRYYSYVFSREIKGEIAGIDRVTQLETLIGTTSKIPASQMFSYAVAIRTPQGEIITASSEDRQWAVAEKGQCVEAKFFPYPPWELDKAGTYHGARLMKLFDCLKK